MSFGHKAAAAVMVGALLGVAGTAKAAFQGRDATGAASGTCTVSGPGKCTYFYDTTLGITILNDWNLGSGSWSASAAPGSAQALAASAGFAASGLTGWVLPTGDGGAPAGALNQYLSIWNSVGGSFAALAAQFDSVLPFNYWSSTGLALNPSGAWVFRPGVNPALGLQGVFNTSLPLFALAVRPGDVAAPIPEPGTYALMLLGGGALLLAKRRRPR